MNIINLTGKVFFRLTVIDRAQENISGKPAWVCRCVCGKVITVRGSDLRMGKHKSCGCFQKEKVTKHGHTKYGGEKSREYTAWAGMKQRCYNLNNPRYKDWGGRGIKVCQRWLDSFENFLADMGACPLDKNSLDRIDNNKDYAPGNCRWANPKEQSQNKRPRKKQLISS